jgi:hypothetical protein
VPVGVPGQIHVGGECVARGYWGRPDLTAERFVPDPFARDGSRMYATGDLGRFLPDGRIEHLGRGDNQVKIRGVRVEPGEVEAHMLQHPGVRDAVVSARQDGSGAHVLVAYYVRRDGALPPEELRRHLRERLPEYMVPAHVVALEALPTLPNGKVDRRSLPAPAGESSGPDAAGEVDESLLAIWREVLKREGIGADQNFFALGGHSLAAMQVIARIRRSHGIDLPIRELFENPTPRLLTQAIRRALASGARRRAPSITPRQRRPSMAVEQLRAELQQLSPSEMEELLRSLRQ